MLFITQADAHARNHVADVSVLLPDGEEVLASVLESVLVHCSFISDESDLWLQGCCVMADLVCIILLRCSCCFFFLFLYLFVKCDDRAAQPMFDAVDFVELTLFSKFRSMPLLINAQILR